MSERQRETDRAYLASIGYELQPESSILRDATPEPNAWHKPAMEDVVLATPEPSATAQPSEPNVCTCRPADSNIWDCPVHGAPTPSAPQADDVEASGAGVVDETTVRDGFDVLPMEQWTVAELIDYISGDYDYTATELTKRFASLRADIDRLRGEVHKGNMDAARLRADLDFLRRERDEARTAYRTAFDGRAWLADTFIRQSARLANAESELAEARRVADRFNDAGLTLRAKNRRLRGALEDAISAVASARKGSIGRIGSHYLPQIEVERVDRWRRALLAPESEDSHE